MWLIFDVCLADSRQTYRHNALRGRGGFSHNTEGCIAPVCVKYSEYIWINARHPWRFGQRCVGTLCRLVFSQHNENGARSAMIWGQDGKTGRQMITKCCNVITGAASDGGWLWAMTEIDMWVFLGLIDVIFAGTSPRRSWDYCFSIVTRPFLPSTKLTCALPSWHDESTSY